MNNIRLREIEKSFSSKHAFYLGKLFLNARTENSGEFGFGHFFEKKKLHKKNY